MAFAAGCRVGPYEILTLLGVGGMGEVYKARDTRLNRMVALKALPAERVSDAGRKQRFLLEAQAASRLNHPNIVTIYDIAEENSACFIAMEYVAGDTLEQMQSSAGLPFQQAIQYASEIADALAAAHAAGIIHRDLKPANIIISEAGRVKLLDFGLAKLADPLETADDAATATLRTIPGAILGTVAYMSPEQAEGREIDARSDIFSFGLVLYEMLCGQRAFRGDSWIATLAAILHDEPQPLREINTAIPVWLEQQVSRCLRKDPSRRFQTMREVRLALIEASVPLVTKEEPASIAVLPFANLSADKENEYFSDGLAEEIINALTKVPELRVIARTSAFAFRGKDLDLRTIGQRLRVGAILEGSVRRAGNRVRVTAQLIKIADESHLWSERYDREMADVFAIQDEISQAIANALQVKLAPHRRRPANIDAFQSYLKGLYWYQRYTADSLAKAKESFEEALRHDPGYAPAFHGLAAFSFGLGALGLRRMTEMAPVAKAAAENALAIDPSLSEAHSILGQVVGAVEYGWPAAEQHYHTAMATEPVPPLVCLRYALYFLTPLRRFDEAVAQYRRALETDPLSMMVHFGLAFAHYCMRRYEEAIELAARSVELYPDYWMLHFALGLALSQVGRLPESIASLETALRLSPSFTLTTGFLAAAYGRTGETERADKLILELTTKSSQRYVSPFCFAVYYAALGKASTMFEFLEAALADRDPYLTRMDTESYFEPFRTDPRYCALLERMNLINRTAVEPSRQI